MNKVIYKVGKDGFIDWDNVKTIKPTENVPEGYIDVPLPGNNESSLYRPRWTGTEWIEDMSQEEIDELKNRPKEPSFEELQLEYNVDLDYRISLIEMGLV